MNIPIGQLAKMKFRFFEDTNMQMEVSRPGFEVMYNPKTLEITYGNNFDCGETLLNGVTTQKFSKRLPRELTVDLIIDGTGASPISIADKIQNFTSILSDKNDVQSQIDKFLAGAYVEQGEKHKPNYVKLSWGKISFNAVFVSAKITYKLFKADGSPLRASISIKLKEHIEKALYERDVNRKSPDLTRAHVILDGDRLDALCEKYYGDSSLYHEVARVNNLSNTRKLVPGNTLVFPPIDKRN